MRANWGGRFYAPIEYGLRLWDLLWEAGRPHGLVMGGAGAFDSLRLEKGYRLWGSDIYSEYNPFEAGLGWAVRLNKGYFLGREALIEAKQHVKRKLCCLTFDDPGAMALGKEPILVDGRTVGYVTSANYGYSVGKHILYGYLPIEYAGPGRAGGGAVLWPALLRDRYGRAAVRPHQQPHEGVGSAPGVSRRTAVGPAAFTPRAGGR